MSANRYSIRDLLYKQIKRQNDSTYIIKCLLPDNSMFKIMVTILDYSIVTMYYNGKIKKRKAIPNEKLHGYLETILYNIKPAKITIERIR